MANIISGTCGLLLVVCCSGCAGMNHLMYNYMCDPTGGQCTRECCQPQSPSFSHPAAAVYPEQNLAPVLPAEISTMQKQMDELSDAHRVINEQLSSLDQKSEERRKESGKVLEVMQKVSENLAYVSGELSEKRREFAHLESRLREQRDRNDRTLSGVEQELNELLSQIDDP